MEEERDFSLWDLVDSSTKLSCCDMIGGDSEPDGGPQRDHELG